MLNFSQFGQMYLNKNKREKSPLQGSVPLSLVPIERFHCQHSGNYQINRSEDIKGYLFIFREIFNQMPYFVPSGN